MHTKTHLSHLLYWYGKESKIRTDAKSHDIFKPLHLNVALLDGQRLCFACGK
jgi:hypothetical protein